MKSIKELYEELYIKIRDNYEYTHNKIKETKDKFDKRLFDWQIEKLKKQLIVLEDKIKKGIKNESDSE